MNYEKTFVVALLVVFQTVPPVFAENPETRSRDNGISEMAAMCLERTCQRALSEAVRKLRRRSLSPDDFNSQLGVLAAALFETAKEAETRRSLRRVSGALARLARYSSDGEQRKSFRWLAKEIRNGDRDLFDLEDPFAVSPS